MDMLLCVDKSYVSILYIKLRTGVGWKRKPA